MNYIKKLLYVSPVVIGFVYLLIGSVWIAFSDTFVLSVVDDPVTITTVQMYKGWGFVAVSSVFIYLLVQNNNNKLGVLISELDQSRQKLETILEQAPVGIAYNKPNEKWLKVNQRLCDLLGYTNEELHKLQFEDFIHPDDLDAGRELDQELINGIRSTFRTEKKYRSKNGDYLIGMVSKSMVFEDDHSPMLITILEDITQQKETEEKLKQTLQQKEILLSEVLHRVNNNLALIVGFLDMELMNIDHESCRDLFKKSQMRIKSVGIVQQKLYQADDFSKLPLEDYVEELLTSVLSSWENGRGQISLNSDTADIKMNVNQAIPCGLILNELVTNSCNHAFPGDVDGEINVKIRNREDEIIMSVSDNGIGLPDNLSVENADTTGFTIIKTLCKQLKADLQVNRDSGTEIVISFKIYLQMRGSAGNIQS